jgi:hypothetical protein
MESTNVVQPAWERAFLMMLVVCSVEIGLVNTLRWQSVDVDHLMCIHLDYQSPQARAFLKVIVHSCAMQEPNIPKTFAALFLLASFGGRGKVSSTEHCLWKIYWHLSTSLRSTSKAMRTDGEMRCNSLQVTEVELWLDLCFSMI